MLVGGPGTFVHLINEKGGAAHTHKVNGKGRKGPLQTDWARESIPVRKGQAYDVRKVQTFRESHQY